MRQRGVGPGCRDRLERDSVGAVPVQQFLQPARQLALADSRNDQGQQLRERGIADRAGAGDGSHLARILALAQRGHGAAGRVQGHFRQPGAQLVAQRYRETGRFERQPAYPGNSQRRCQFLGGRTAMALDPPLRALPGRLLQVAHVGQQQRQVRRDHRVPRASRKPGEIPQVEVCQVLLPHQQQTVEPVARAQPVAHGCQAAARRRRPLGFTRRGRRGRCGRCVGDSGACGMAPFCHKPSGLLTGRGDGGMMYRCEPLPRAGCRRRSWPSCWPRSPSRWRPNHLPPPQPGALVGAFGQTFGPPPDHPTGDLDPATRTDIETIIASIAERHLDTDALGRLQDSSDARILWFVADLLRFIGRSELETLNVTFEALTGVTLPRGDYNAIPDHLMAWDLPAFPGYRPPQGRPDDADRRALGSRSSPMKTRR